MAKGRLRRSSNSETEERVQPDSVTCFKWVGAITLAALLLGSSVRAPTFAANGAVVYTYDALGRVTTASYDTGVIVIYTYDANGNRLSQVINVNSSSGTWGSFNWGAALWH